VVGGENQIVVPPVAGNRFYRLRGQSEKVKLRKQKPEMLKAQPPDEQSVLAGVDWGR